MVIVTRNRAAELAVALESCLRQSVPLELLVVDDASGDGTAALVRERFPSVRLERRSRSHGYIDGRNLGAALATTPFIVSIDDDARFDDPATVERTLADFACEDIAAVSMPRIDVHVSPAVLNRAPDARRIHATDTFVGTAYAVRREVFLALGGFRAGYVHQVEEQEFGMRLLRAGHRIRLGTAPPVLHTASPTRDPARVARYEARNNLLMAWEHLPRLAMLRSLARNLVFFTATGLRRGHALASARGLASGLSDIVSGRALRSPMSESDYGKLRELRRSLRRSSRRPP